MPKGITIAGEISREVDGNGLQKNIETRGRPKVIQRGEMIDLERISPDVTQKMADQKDLPERRGKNTNTVNIKIKRKAVKDHQENLKNID